MSTPDPFNSSPRVAALKRDLIKQLPRSPNDRASLQLLQAEPLTNLLIIYLSWRLRHVRQRTRTVVGQAVLASDPRVAALQPGIDMLLAAVGMGDDLTPWLSLKPRTDGYVPAARVAGTPRDSWLDKDFILNVLGYHHFHLGTFLERKGHIKRTHELLFAAVTHDRFEVLGLFDHSTFSRRNGGIMTPERTRLWAAYDAHWSANVPPASLNIGGYGGLGITTRGDSIMVVMTAQKHVQIMRDMDSKLDDRSFVRTLPGFERLSRPRLKWYYRFMDFGVLDTSVENAWSFVNCCRWPT